MKLTKKNTYIMEKFGKYTGNRISSPEVAANLCYAALDMLDDHKEHFLSLSLNTKNNLIALNVISIGSMNMNIVHPREVYYAAIQNRACAIIVCHNHPSGDISPSQNDIDITRKLQESGKIIGIDMYDHIIIGNISQKESSTYYSMKEKL